MLWPRSLSCTGLLIQLETGGGKSSCMVVEQCECVYKAQVNSMWVRLSAMIDATFDLLGIHVTNNLHANAPATR